jgi:hypothetical protein
MIGPPFLKLSIRKFELNIPGFGVGAGVALGLAVGAAAAGDSNVTGTEAPGLARGCVPGAPGLIAGFAGIPGLAIAGKVAAGLPVTGAAGGASCCEAGVADSMGVWANAASANAVEQMQAVSSVFIN